MPKCLLTQIILWFNDSTYRLQKTLICCRGISGVGAGEEVTWPACYFPPALQLPPLEQLFSWHPWIDGPGPERKTAALRWWPDPAIPKPIKLLPFFSSTSKRMALALSEVPPTTLPATAVFWLQHAVQVSTSSVGLSIRTQIVQKKAPKRLFLPRNMLSCFHESKVN